MNKTIIAAALALSGATAAYAYGAFYSPYAVGTVYPAPASAVLTCYVVDSGFRLADGARRDNVLATLERRNADGTTAEVCFLRPPAADPNWAHVVTPQPQPQPQPATCPGYPNAPSPGMTCHADGGWR